MEGDAVEGDAVAVDGEEAVVESKARSWLEPPHAAKPTSAAATANRVRRRRIAGVAGDVNSDQEPT